MKLFHKRGGGVNRISYLLFRTAYVFRNTVKVLNKDFIKAVGGGGVTVLWNFFIKFRFFLAMASLIDTAFNESMFVFLTMIIKDGET